MLFFVLRGYEKTKTLYKRSRLLSGHVAQMESQHAAMETRYDVLATRLGGCLQAAGGAAGLQGRQTGEL